MAEDNAELFRRGSKLVGSGDEEAALELVTEDIEFIPLRSSAEGPYRGHAGVRRFMQDTREAFELFDPDYEDVRDLGDGRVLGLGSIRVKGRGSGVETEVSTAAFAVIRDGRMSYFRDYGDHEAALAAAGLR